LFAASLVTLLLLLPACSVNVKKEANGEDKQVDIKTLVGGFHVRSRPTLQMLAWPFIPARD
jgi:hypothetical protein